MPGQAPPGPDIRVTLLGRFAVSVGGVPVPEAAWKRRHAAAVVKVLALAPGRRLHREQVIDLIWPDDTIAAAVPKLHKAAHYARHAIGVPDAVVLRGDQVLLCPGAAVTVDAAEFDELARRALAGASNGDGAAAARRALALYAGELLPADRYEEWAEPRRDQLRRQHLELLRLDGPLLGRDLELSAAEQALLDALYRTREDPGTASAIFDGYLCSAEYLLYGPTPYAEVIELHRVFGTMISVAADPREARQVVERSESMLGWDDFCQFCSIMRAVPAAIACARDGDLPAARRHVAVAEQSATVCWRDTSWDAGLAEAHAAVAMAIGDAAGARERLRWAAGRFQRAGQPLDAARCLGRAEIPARPRSLAH
ncbi:MAG TPA: BTAD domain-containing putative transcriptional regulator [Streptosporangiaceae bacterium]|nr:BTAD domain-containing putative transcriptional regulator [Streptosporangiaceae bacterium]